ncbi:MAG TPA: hypothetical protein ENF77_00620 [Candidatus Acetothermia bacterium]|nr:hypothetical protein [Candidatus Acetothermia bacterium]
MRVIVVGLGHLGRRLAERLAGKGMELVLIDRDETRCKEAAERYDALVLRGDGTDPELLEKAGAQEAEALVAATDSDPINTVVGILAKRAGTKQVIVVLNDLALRTACQVVGVDRVISPVLAATEEITGFITGKETLDFSVAVSGGARVAELSPGPLAGKKLGEIPLPKGTAVPVVLREGKALVADVDLVLKADDVLVALAQDEKRLEELRTLFGKEEG